MVRIPARDLALELIQDCLAYGSGSPRTLDALVERALDASDEAAAAAATRALFGIVIERLGDLFEPALCDVYARMFSRVIDRVLPDLDAANLYTRYNRVRAISRFSGGEVNRVFVLSRVTLGADIAVTSVVLDGLKRRFPGAEICFVGPAKNAELFAADQQITPVAVPYDRNAGLRERLLPALELKGLVDMPGAIVVDPDSRLTQLGLIPVCDDSRYYFFESRAFGGQSDLNLTALTRIWLEEVFGIGASGPYLAPDPQAKIADYAVSWGVGENEDKRVSLEFETNVLKQLLGKGKTVLLDCGAGDAEAKRVTSLQQRLASPALFLHQGSYASFADHIRQSSFYVGYDSAGQHVAAAARIPLLSIFRGFSSDRMLARWRPQTPGASVIAVRDESESLITAEATQVIADAT